MSNEDWLKISWTISIQIREQTMLQHLPNVCGKQENFTVLSLSCTPLSSVSCVRLVFLICSFREKAESGLPHLVIFVLNWIKRLFQEAEIQRDFTVPKGWLVYKQKLDLVVGIICLDFRASPSHWVGFSTVCLFRLLNEMSLWSKPKTSCVTMIWHFWLF